MIKRRSINYNSLSAQQKANNTNGRERSVFVVLGFGLPCKASTHPALLLFLFVFSVLAQAAHAGVAGRAVDAGHALRRVLPADTQVWG